MTQEALKLALEALEENHHLIEEHERPEYLVHYDQIISLLAKALAKEKALQALHDENERLGLYKDAYAQPEQEPVAHWSDCAVHSEPAYPKGECDCGGFATPPQRTWVGLTDDERDHLTGLHLYAVKGQVEAWIEGVDDFAQAIEAKLKEKNT